MTKVKLYSVFLPASRRAVDGDTVLRGSGIRRGSGAVVSGEPWSVKERSLGD